MVDDYRLAVPLDTPAVVADLSAGLVDAAGERVPLAGGGDRAILARLHVRERRPLSAAQLPGRTATYRLGDAVRLVGHAVTLRPPAAGEADGRPALDVTLYWQASRQLPADYTVFVHVSDGGGRASRRGMARRWRASTRRAPGGRDRSSPTTAGWPCRRGARRGRLSVAVGLYTPSDGARLPVTDSRGRRLPQDQIVLNPPGR